MAEQPGPTICFLRPVGWTCGIEEVLEGGLARSQGWKRQPA